MICFLDTISLRGKTYGRVFFCSLFLLVFKGHLNARPYYLMALQAKA